MKRFLAFWLAVVCSAILSPVALAQTFSAPDSANIEGAVVGSDTAGSETGIHEFQAVVTTAVGVFIAIAVFWGGWYLARRIIRSATRST